MENSAGKKTVLIGFAFVFFVGLVAMVMNAHSYTKEREGYIEVGGDRIAYVPRMAKFVKVNGEVRRIVKFASSLSAADEDCECPYYCCKGSCYIIVFSDGLPGGNPIKVLTVIWLAC